MWKNIHNARHTDLKFTSCKFFIIKQNSKALSRQIDLSVGMKAIGLYESADESKVKVLYELSSVGRNSQFPGSNWRFL